MTGYPEVYLYQVSVDGVMKNAAGEPVLWLLREEWYRHSDGVRVGRRITSSPHPPKTLKEFLQEIGVSLDEY